MLKTPHFRYCALCLFASPPGAHHLVPDTFNLSLEISSALNETRADTQQEYKEDNATQILIILKTRYKGSNISSFFRIFANKFAKTGCTSA